MEPWGPFLGQIHRQERVLQVLGARAAPTWALTGPLTKPIFTVFYRIFGLSWETSPQTDSTPEASKHSGSRRIEFSSKSTTFLMKQFLYRPNLEKKHVHVGRVVMQ